jgi:hypothetical protein
MRLKQVLVVIAILSTSIEACLRSLPTSTASASGGGIVSTITNFDRVGHEITRFDAHGNAIDAHDGEIKLFGHTYYLYGTSYDCGFQLAHTGPFCGFKVYSSPDLVHWTDRGMLFDPHTDYWQQHCSASTTFGCFRPHVIYNAHTGRYVLWFNIYDASTDTNYRVFESRHPTGPFVERPTPAQLAVSTDLAAGEGYNGDENLFVDDDGTAYLVHTDFRRGGDIVVEQLDSRYETGTGRFARLGLFATEAPAMFKHNGRYYITVSDPNCAYCGGGAAVYNPACPVCSGTGTSYMTAPTPLGPWTGTDSHPPSYWQSENRALLITGAIRQPTDGGAAAYPANGGDVGLSANGRQWTDYRFSFDTMPLMPTTGGPAVEAGWAFRAPYPTDGYVWTIGNSSSVDATGRLTKTILQKGRVRWTHTVPLPFPIRAGQEYHVETGVVGSTMTTTVSTTATNQQFTDVSGDATYARGRVGFVENTADSTLARFTNVRVIGADGTTLLADDFAGDLSQWDPPLPRRLPIKISTDSCGGQPTNVARIPTTRGPLYLYQSDLWNDEARNEALANYYWGPLTFGAAGRIQPLTCRASFPVALAVGRPGRYAPPADLDQASGVAGFRTFCDIHSNIERMQTFTPSRTGILTRVGFTTFQSVQTGLPSAPLTVDLVRVRADGRPMGPVPLATQLFWAERLPRHAIGLIGWSPRTITMHPRIRVSAGRLYGLVVHSATASGCYGFAYNDGTSYTRGQELYSKDGGHTFQVEPGRVLKFTTSVTQRRAVGCDPRAASHCDRAHGITSAHHHGA